MALRFLSPLTYSFTLSCLHCWVLVFLRRSFFRIIFFIHDLFVTTETKSIAAHNEIESVISAMRYSLHSRYKFFMFLFSVYLYLSSAFQVFPLHSHTALVTPLPLPIVEDSTPLRATLAIPLPDQCTCPFPLPVRSEAINHTAQWDRPHIPQSDRSRTHLIPLLDPPIMIPTRLWEQREDLIDSIDKRYLLHIIHIISHCVLSPQNSPHFSRTFRNKCTQ